MNLTTLLIQSWTTTMNHKSFSMKELQNLINEEAQGFAKPIIVESGPWLGVDDELTDTCPMCGLDSEGHEAEGCDYEQCGICSYDHSYEPEEAHNAHLELDPDNL